MMLLWWVMFACSCTISDCSYTNRLSGRCGDGAPSQSHDYRGWPGLSWVLEPLICFSRTGGSTAALQPSHDPFCRWSPCSVPRGCCTWPIADHSSRHILQLISPPPLSLVSTPITFTPVACTFLAWLVSLD